MNFPSPESTRINDLAASLRQLSRSQSELVSALSRLRESCPVTGASGSINADGWAPSIPAHSQVSDLTPEESDAEDRPSSSRSTPVSTPGDSHRLDPDLSLHPDFAQPGQGKRLSAPHSSFRLPGPRGPSTHTHGFDRHAHHSSRAYQYPDENQDAVGYQRASDTILGPPSIRQGVPSPDAAGLSNFGDAHLTHHDTSIAQVNQSIHDLPLGHNKISYPPHRSPGTGNFSNGRSSQLNWNPAAFQEPLQVSTRRKYDYFESLERDLSALTDGPVADSAKP